ncbi:MAG: tRNA (guanosine(18)-2'-O)-methyltransferase [Deltaproteobacteria bacterium ADurb.Bin510]|nr:MAG: tRNA (guanosine(18)-2'-O)-methyltransferase [Deltaproteobacteria bacterium ADurb.Bin510]
MESITSRQNPQYKALVHASRDKGLLMLEGQRLVGDALRRGLKPLLSALTPRYAEQHGLPEFAGTILSEHLFATLTETEQAQGILIFVEQPWCAVQDLHPLERLLILDRLQDPGNVGTLIRTAEAFGFDGVIMTPGTANPYQPKAVRASMGSCLGLKLARAGLPEIARLPQRLISLSLDGAVSLRQADLSAPLGLILGQEAGGVCPELAALASQKVLIAMPGLTESLNVAVAGGIVMAAAAGSL